YQTEFRVRRPNGELRWCIGTAAATLDAARRVVRVSGVTVDITERKLAEERQVLLAREVDHRARNALAVVQSIVRLTRAEGIDEYVLAVEGRIRALSRAHMLLARALALHELATNAAKYGALSSAAGKVGLRWELEPDRLVLEWSETGGPAVE